MTAKGGHANVLMADIVHILVARRYIMVLLCVKYHLQRLPVTPSSVPPMGMWWWMGVGLGQWPPTPVTRATLWRECQ